MVRLPPPFSDRLALLTGSVANRPSQKLAEIVISKTDVVCLHLFNKIHPTCQFPHTGVRKGAVMALGQFCSGFHTLLQEAGAEDKTACMCRLVENARKKPATLFT